jgi:hypothetical protein
MHGLRHHHKSQSHGCGDNLQSFLLRLVSDSFTTLVGLAMYRVEKMKVLRGQRETGDGASLLQSLGSRGWKWKEAWLRRFGLCRCLGSIPVRSSRISLRGGQGRSVLIMLASCGRARKEIGPSVGCMAELLWPRLSEGHDHHDGNCTDCCTGGL